MCETMFNCFATTLNFGIRSAGGIGDVLVTGTTFSCLLLVGCFLSCNDLCITDHSCWFWSSHPAALSPLTDCSAVDVAASSTLIEPGAGGRGVARLHLLVSDGIRLDILHLDCLVAAQRGLGSGG